MNLSSQLTYNMHRGAEDLRIVLTTNFVNNFLPQSWQDSLYDLSNSVVGLWDSIVRGVSLLSNSAPNSAQPRRRRVQGGAPPPFFHRQNIARVMALHIVCNLSEFLLGDRARAEAASPPAEETVREIAEPLAASVRGRTPGATPFDAEVLLNTYGIAGATAVKAYLALPEPRDPDAGRALVRRAFEVLRDMR